IAGVDTELVPESLEDLNALQGEADLRLGGKLCADAAGRLAGGAGADGIALEHDHVMLATPREMVGDAAPDHAAADDYDARGPREIQGRRGCGRGPGGCQGAPARARGVARSLVASEARSRWSTSDPSASPSSPRRHITTLKPRSSALSVL